ncbi:MAG: response regulator [Phycisphaerae bacterium]|jgi:CheY-like chemotaxis protein
MFEDSDLLRGRRILVVDDSAEMTSLLVDFLTGLGATVAFSNGGREAICRLAWDRFDAVVLDLVMPEPDGWEVLRVIGAVKPELLPGTMVLTGNRYTANAPGLRRACPVSCLFKPFLLDDLAAMIHDKVLAGARHAGAVQP